jgi:NhaA family Na+:H+ antiporter
VPTDRPARPTWLTSDRLLARSVARPVQRFLDIEAAGGILLVGAAVVAVVWASSPWSDSYHELWATVATLEVGDLRLSMDLRHWVNDGLMALFFLVIGLEIKRELVVGELASRQRAIVPAVGALGGMVVPALVYLAVSSGEPAGWGIPMATDVAFAVGALALLGTRAPTELKVLLLALAIVDDIGAIVVIAVAYTEELSLGWLGVAVAGIALVAALRRAGVWYHLVYATVGVAVWLALHESGVHATLAGVAMGLLAPARPLLHEVDAGRIAHQLSADHDVTVEEVREIAFQVRESVSITERLQGLLHPWTSFLIVPVFALANAGVAVSASALADAATSPVTLGVAAGLVVGKVVGITGAIALAVRAGWGRLPPTVTLRHVAGMAGLAGIGFTVSIFVAGLAFDDPALVEEATLGILAASVLAAGLGSAVLLRVGPDAGGGDPGGTGER